jgi:hypothetical protein
VINKLGATGRWVLVGAALLELPCCVLVLLELHPSSNFLDHLSGAVTLFIVGFLLIGRPATGSRSHQALPREHVDAFKYAIRTGKLPLTSLFSNWSSELAQCRVLLDTALRILPAVTCAVLALNLYGMLIYAEDLAFFLFSALAAGVASLATFSSAAMALRNVHDLEGQLRTQQQFLDTATA